MGELRSAVVTIIARNYLAHARVLMESVRRWAPGMLRIVILVDRVDGAFSPQSEDFLLIASEDLGIPDSRWFHFKYTVLELATAVKPFALEFLIHRYELDRIFYFDPDIQIHSPLTPVLQRLDKANLLLTPHLTGELDDGYHPSELDILRSGTYNLGFLGIARGEESLRFLKWWQVRLHDRCLIDLNRGLFVDQRWIDLAPGLFSGLEVCRHPGCNVAYWNLNHRNLVRRDNRYFVNGAPLCFFHFSGLNPDQPESLSRHQDRFHFQDLGDVRHLITAYVADLHRHGYSECSRLPYAYGRFSNGFPIPELGRGVLHEMPEVAQSIADPFSDEGYQTFLRLWTEPVTGQHGRRSGVTRLAYRIYRSREDVMAEMPDLFGRDRLRFLEWLLSSGKREHSLDGRLLSPIYDAVQAARLHRGLAMVESGDEDVPSVCQRMLLEAGPNDQEATPAAGQTGGPRLTRLARYVYEARPDLQRIFPDPCGKDAASFFIWLLTYGKHTYHLTEPWLAPIRQEWLRLLKSMPVAPSIRYRGLLLAMSWSVAARTRAARFARRHRRLPAGHNLPPTDAETSITPITGCNIAGYLRGDMGVGQSARAAVLAARAVGLDARLKNIHVSGPQGESDTSLLQVSDSFPHRVNIFHVNADESAAVLKTIGEPFRRERYNIGFWAWELEDFPVEWTSAFEPFREIWTPSAFCQDAISRRAPIPVVRMPHAIPEEPSAQKARTDFGLDPRSFLFLTSFDMLSVFERKNPLAAIGAFQQAFAGRDDVELAIKVNHAGSAPSHMSQLRAAAAGRRVRILSEPMPRPDVQALLRCADCFVSLHRSEGFGLLLAEAMLCGKPVIATGYSGNLDFMTPGNSFLVDYQLCPVGPGAAPYSPLARWAEPSRDHAASQMQLVLTNRELARTRAAIGQACIREQLSPLAVGGRMRERLEQILQSDSKRVRAVS
jgi:glycosyltransferase involved in cell wall biosynthesis